MTTSIKRTLQTLSECGIKIDRARLNMELCKLPPTLTTVPLKAMGVLSGSRGQVFLAQVGIVL